MRDFSGIFDINNVIDKIEERIRLINEAKVHETVIALIDTDITQEQVEIWITEKIESNS